MDDSPMTDDAQHHTAEAKPGSPSRPSDAPPSTSRPHRRGIYRSTPPASPIGWPRVIELTLLPWVVGAAGAALPHLQPHNIRSLSLLAFSFLLALLVAAAGLFFSLQERIDFRMLCALCSALVALVVAALVALVAVNSGWL